MNKGILSLKMERGYAGALTVGFILLLGLLCPDVYARDARTGVQSGAELLERAQGHKEEVVARVKELENLLAQDRDKVENKLSRLRAEVRDLDRKRTQLQKQVRKRRTELEAQQEIEREHNQRHTELLGSIHTSITDVVGMIKNSPVTALQPQKDQKLQELLDSDQTPGIEAVRIVRDLMMRQIQGGAQVQHQHINIVDRRGKQVNAEVVLLGAFTALYRSETEVGFALYSPPSRQLLALSQAPGYSREKAIEAYMDGGRTPRLSISVTVRHCAR